MMCFHLFNHKGRALAFKGETYKVSREQAVQYEAQDKIETGKYAISK